MPKLVVRRSAPPPIDPPEPHIIVRRGDPITSRMWAENLCADGGKKLSALLVESLRHVIESPGLTQTEHEHLYPVEVPRTHTKWFNELAKRGMVYGYVGRRCSVTGAFCIVWYPTPAGIEYVGGAGS